MCVRCVCCVRACARVLRLQSSVKPSLFLCDRSFPFSFFQKEKNQSRCMRMQTGTHMVLKHPWMWQARIRDDTHELVQNMLGADGRRRGPPWANPQQGQLLYAHTHKHTHTHTQTHHQRHWRNHTCPWSSSFSVDHMYLVVCVCVCVCVCVRVYQHRTRPWNISISAVEASTPPPPSPTNGPSNLNGDLPIKKLSVNTKQFS